MAFAAVSCDAVWLLKALATDLAGEAQGGRGLCMLAPVPVQGGLLAAGEPADLTPVPGSAEGSQGPRPSGLSVLPAPSSKPHTHCSGFSPVWMRRWMTRLLLVRKDRAQNSQM